MANWVASREGSGRTGKESGREGCHAVGNGLAVHGSDALGMRCKAVHRARECVRRVSRAEGARAAGIAARGGPPYFFRVAESKASSDIAMGRRPEPKSDEFSSHTPLIYEDNCNFVFETCPKWLTLFASTTLGEGAGRAPNNCTTFWKIRYFHTSVTFERPSVPQKTQRIWTWGAARIPNPMSFRRYGWPFMS